MPTTNAAVSEGSAGRAAEIGGGRRVNWPRDGARARAGTAAPAAVGPLRVAAVPVLAPRESTRPLWGGDRGKSRFVLSPLSLTLDQLLFLITAALLCFGLIMVQSADARIRPTAFGKDNWVSQAFNNKNMLHAFISMMVMTIFWRLDYRMLLGKSRRNSLFAMLTSPASWLVVLTVGFLAAVLATPLGKEINGARRWFGFGPLGFQPSELAKLSLVLFVAAYAVHRAASIRSFWWGFLPLIATFALCAVLVIKEDFGTTVLISAVVVAMIAMAGCRWWHVLMLVPPGVFVVWAAIFRDTNSFRYKRFMAFLHPEADAQGAGYHVIQSLLTIASGAPWGRGLGNGIQKMGYLPEDNTDFIFAVVCEELGLVGAFMVVGLFAAFVVVGWRVMCRCENLFGKMVAFGITAIIGLQAAINIAVVTASMPTKGIALPLISSGGTGWIMNAAAIGVLMSIERVNRREELVRSSQPSGRGFDVIPTVPAQPVIPVPAVPVLPAAATPAAA